MMDPEITVFNYSGRNGEKLWEVKVLLNLEKSSRISQIKKHLQ